MIHSYIITIMYNPYLSALLIKRVIEQTSAAAHIVIDNFLCEISDLSIAVRAGVHVKSSLLVSEALSFTNKNIPISPQGWL